MPGLPDFALRGRLTCKRPFVDGDGNIWLPGDPLEFTSVISEVYYSGVTRVLYLVAEDIEQGEVLREPHLYFELPPVEG